MNKKENKKNGFTITELMAVLVIIAIIATLVITSVTGYKEKGKKEYIKSLENQVVLAAKAYYSDNPKELPRGQVEGDYKIYSKKLMAYDLAQNNYFQNEIVDEAGNSCEAESYVIVTNSNGSYDYSPCLKCNNNVISENNNCKYEETKIPYCSVYVKDSEKYSSYVKELKVITNTTTEVISEQGLTVNEDGVFVVVDPGYYSFKVNGTEATCATTIYMKEDEEAPTCSITCTNKTNTTAECSYTISDNAAIKSATSDIGGLNLEYDCTDDSDSSRLTGINDSIKNITRGSTKQTINITVTDCKGKSSTCQDTIDKKQTNYVPDDDGDEEECYGSSCSDPDDDDIVDENGRCISNECYAPGAEEESGCYYYYCDSNCNLHSSYICEESNPNTGCFLAGTKVLTSTGYKNIEDIEIGDVVLSYNEITKEKEYNRVYEKFVHTNNNEDIYELTINGKVLKVTESHRFYAKEKGKTDFIWKEAKSLSVGDILLDSNNKESKISNIINYSHFGTVYNFAVENNHNYYVSENGYLVHNCKCGDPGCTVDGSGTVCP